ncbi:MAG: DUF342 domain-containing protein [Thermodesulfobacteriota bacterium]
MSASQNGQEITGYLKLQGDPDYPVFAGQAFALLVSEPEEVVPDSDRADKQGQEKEARWVRVSSSSCVYRAQSGELLAKGYGLVKFSGDRLQVIPLMRVSKNRLHLLATLYSRDFFAQQITLDRISQAVSDLGLQAKVQEEEVARALQKAAKKGEPQSGVVIASGGDLPMEARDAKLELAGEPGLPVFPGFVLGRIIQGQECVWGKCIDGSPLEPDKKDPPLRIEPTQKCGWELGTDQETMYATRYGLLGWQQGKPFVSPLLKISKNRLKVWANLYAKDFCQKKISVQGIKDVLQDLGLKAEVEEEAVANALKLAKKTKAAQENVLVAQGSKPIQGEDGRVVFAWEEAEAAKTQQAGELDPRQRSLYRSVEEGQTICWLQPPGIGRPGLDVFGKEIPAQPGSSAQITLGQNVQVYKNGQPLLEPEAQEGTGADGPASAEGESGHAGKGGLQGQVITESGAEIRALVSGIVIWDGQNISVQEAVQIKGDVDFSTGNLAFGKGDVHIQGNVRGGFSVKTPGSVYVKQSVEGALVQTGGDCIVNAGLSMHEKGSVTVGGCLQAHFLENATVKARGDVIVTQDIVNSLVFSLGRVLSTRGRGTIQGGLIRAAEGLECNVLGSEHGVSTRVVLSFNAEGNPDLVQRRDKLKKRLQKIQEIIGEDNYQTLLQKTPKEKHRQLIEMLKAKSSIVSELKELKTKIKESRQALVQKALESKVQVHDIVYPGVELTIGEQTLEVKEPLHGPTFYLDFEDRAIKIA